MGYLIAVGVVGVVWGLLALHVSRIKRNPDLFSFDVLSADPRGETLLVDRPDGGVVRVVVAGEGPTVVMAHGYGVSLREWNVVMDQLVDDGYKVMVFDQMGHGGSSIGSEGLGLDQMAANYLLLFEHFDLTDVVLVGHSMGGFLSVAALVNHPQLQARLRGWVLFATMAGEVAKGAPQTRLQVPLIRSGVLMRLIQLDLFGYPFGASLMGDDVSPAAIRVLLDEMLSQDHSKLIPILNAMVRESFYDQIDQIKVPTVVICGLDDKTTPSWHSEALGRDIPNARNVWIANRGHVLNWEAPEELVSVVKQLHAGS